MHVERVDGLAFGPLRDEVLELAPGCTVVHGPNESGKSSWHAALTTAVTGRRRGRGGRTGAERDFAERHRPWDGDRWLVGARVRLADGRVVSLRQDLDEPARCQANDQTGRPVLDEILADGMPDASRWLGLDREAFRACVSVRQSDVARVSEGAGSLQQYLQRAASTRKAESTAGAALERLRDYKAKQVGLDKRSAVKPLRRAKTAVAHAQDAVVQATASHRALLETTEECERLLAVAEQARRARRAAEALEAARQADEVDRRVTRIADLTARCPEEPPDQGLDDQEAQEVAAALARWDERPTVPDPPSPSAAELHARLAEPVTEVGDTEVHATVQDAVRSFESAREAFDQHRDREPAGHALPPGTEPVELRELARRLRAEPPPVDPPPSPAPTPASVPVLVGAAGLVAGVAIAFAGLVPLGVVVALAGAVGAVLVSRRRAAAAAATPVVVPAPSPVRARVAELGLSPDPDALDASAAAADLHQGWADEVRKRREQVDRAAAALTRVIEDRMGTTVAPDTTLRDWYAAYEETCRASARRARVDAEERARLGAAVARAEEIEKRSTLARDACARAAAELRATADAVGLAAIDDAELLAEGLRAWQEARKDRIEAMRLRRDDWKQLQQLGGGRSLEEWESMRDEARGRAEDLLAGVDPDELARLRAAGTRLPELVETERRAHDRAQQARAALEVTQANLPSVAEANESLATAEAELGRVMRLDDVLSTTIDCLGEAQDRLYRSLAPVLAERLNDVLPSITGGRYREVTVDPESLEVQVRLADGSLRPAGLLSHGTAEQVYLLLRVAMAERLVSGRDTCPLVLDDVTVHCDPERTRAILDLLLAVAEHRQVVLFTQEADVVAWAEEALRGDRHRIVSLGAPAVPA
jgi:DNA repair exonuclease SbcCD ATPase subunit